MSLYVCVGCGKPADMSGDTDCDCASGLIAVKGEYCSAIWRPRTIDGEIARLEAQIEELKQQRQSNINLVVQRLIA